MNNLQISLSSGLLVSIGIPSYNEGEGILRLLDSLRGQEQDETFKILDVIISDDSSDETPHLIEDYASRHPSPPVRMLHYDERRGQPAAWNELMVEAKGDILVLLDGDVSINSQLVSSFARHFAARSDVGLVVGNVQPFPSKNFAGQASYLVGLWLQRVRQRPQTSPFTVIGRCVAIRREVYREIFIPRHAVSSDLYLECRALELGYRIESDDNAVACFQPAESFREFASQTLRATVGHRQLRNYLKKVFTTKTSPAEQLVEMFKVLKTHRQYTPAFIAAYTLLPFYAPRVLRGASSHLWEVAYSSKTP